MNNSQILWISAFLPYKAATHASGKIHYYYLKKLIQEEKYDIRLISFYEEKELEKFEFSNQIECDLVCYQKGFKRILRGVGEIPIKYNPFDKYGGLVSGFSKRNIIDRLKQYKKDGYIPDVIILEWTQILLFASKIKTIFPKAKIVGIEEDVILLSYKRKMEFEKSLFKKKLATLRFRNIEKQEIDEINNCDLVILNNKKDMKLLSQYEINTTLKCWVPFYYNYVDVEREQQLENWVVFYGAMNRKENYLSAIWFIEHVIPLTEDIDYKFYIVGGNPIPALKQYENDKIIVTGFVDDVREYLGKAMCLAAPLVLGAGIKIKVLESMSAGIPVLTNDIGIEGIYAEDKKEYFYCESPEDYASVIRDIFDKKVNVAEISHNQRAFMRKNFDYEKSAIDFISWIEKLCVN